MLAFARRDHGRGALVLRIDLVQSLVQARRASNGQRREKGDDNANANAGAGLHASRRFTLRADLRKYFERPRKRARIESNPILIPSGVPRVSKNRITNTNTNILVRVAHASRVSGEGVLAIAKFCCGFNDKKSLFLRDAESPSRTGIACATRSR